MTEKCKHCGKDYIEGTNKMNRPVCCYCGLSQDELWYSIQALEKRHYILGKLSTLKNVHKRLEKILVEEDQAMVFYHLGELKEELWAEINNFGNRNTKGFDGNCTYKKDCPCIHCDILREKNQKLDELESYVKNIRTQPTYKTCCHGENPDCTERHSHGELCGCCRMTSRAHIIKNNILEKIKELQEK